MKLPKPCSDYHRGPAMSFYVSLLALGCAEATETPRTPAPPAPLAATAPPSTARPEPRTVIEKATVVPFIEGFLGEPLPSAALYVEGAPPPRPIVPFQFGYQESPFHLIAFFDGHPQLEAVECMARPDPSRPDRQRIFAITTAHDNHQEYYVPDHEAEVARTVSVPVHRSDMVCEVAPDWKGARLELTTAAGERVALSFVAAEPPNPKWGLIPDPGGHNPTGGPVVMVVHASSIAIPPSGVTIGGKSYPLVPHEASQPPYFIGFHSYLTQDFAYSYLSTHAPLALAAVTPAGEPRAFDAAGDPNAITAELVPGPSGVVEVAAIRAHRSTLGQERFGRIEFNPPFPNLRAMRPDTEVKLRFAWTMTLVEHPVVLGELVVARHGDEATVQLLPAYPGWAKDGHHLACGVDLGRTPVTTKCEALP